VPCSNILHIILDKPSEGLDDENVALVAQLISLSQDTNMQSYTFLTELSQYYSKINELTPDTTGSTGKIRT
jgi:molybdate transport system ATP-binding protein